MSVGKRKIGVGKRNMGVGKRNMSVGKRNVGGDKKVCRGYIEYREVENEGSEEQE